MTSNHCVVLHLHYQDLWPEFWSYLKNIKGIHYRNFKFAAMEGEEFVAPFDCLVAYGTIDKFTYKFLSKNTKIIFDNQTFGDPYLNRRKIGLIAEDVVNVDLYVTVNNTKTEWYNNIKANATDVFIVENKGLDVGGFLYAYNKIKHLGYHTITKLHSKKSIKLKLDTLKPSWGDDQWRRDLYLPLIRTTNGYLNICTKFNEDLDLYLVGSRRWLTTDSQQAIDENVASSNLLNTLLNNFELERSTTNSVFFAGTMFTASARYLDMVFNNNEMKIYENLELGFDVNTNFTVKNGTIPHAFERLIGGEIYVNNFRGYLLGIENDGDLNLSHRCGPLESLN